MKKLEELGISPSPWKCIGYHNHKNGECIHLGEVRSADNRKMVWDLKQPDAKMFAAAPELYDAVQRYISADDEMDGVVVNEELIERRKIAFRDMRSALAKAAGERECK